MANYMKQVAKMLGIELGEEFMCSNGYKYILREDGIIDFQYNNDCRFDARTFSNVLNDLLTGKLVIKRKLWKPMYEDRYWAVYPRGKIDNYFWKDDMLDNLFYKIGNCYRTEEEAKANRDKWVAFYASDEVLEV